MNLFQKSTFVLKWGSKLKIEFLEKFPIYVRMKLYEEIYRINQLLSESKNSEIIHIPNLNIFSTESFFSNKEKWDLLRKFLIRIGNPNFTLGGNLYLGKEQKIESLGNLKSLSGSLILNDSDLKSFGYLEKIGGNVNIRNSEIKSLDNIQTIGGDLEIHKQEIKSLGNLEYVGLDLFISDCTLNSLNNLESVGGNCIIHNSDLKNVGKLKTVGGQLVISSTTIYKNRKLKEKILSQVDARNGIFFS